MPTFTSTSDGIKLERLQQLLQKCFRNISNEQITDLFMKMDKDMNGVVDHSTCISVIYLFAHGLFPEEFVEYANEHLEAALMLQHMSTAIQRDISMSQEDFQLQSSPHETVITLDTS